LTQARLVIRDQWKRMSCKDILLCCCCCCRRSANPPHSKMLEALMRNAGYSDEEKSVIRSSALGPKRLRKERMQMMFAGQANDAESFLAQEPGGPDIMALKKRRRQEKNMKKGDDEDPEPDDTEEDDEDADDYLTCLKEDSMAHSRREYDPEETKVAQLRELVTIAEAETTFMRERVETCQMKVRCTFSDLTSNLVRLEKLIHASLEQIVAIATMAGVPDRLQAYGVDNKKDSTGNRMTDLQLAKAGIVTLPEEVSSTVTRVIDHQANVPDTSAKVQRREWHAHLNPTSSNQWQRAHTSVERHRLGNRLVAGVGGDVQGRRNRTGRTGGR